jgi:hypothetical protein
VAHIHSLAAGAALVYHVGRLPDDSSLGFDSPLLDFVGGRFCWGPVCPSGDLLVLAFLHDSLNLFVEGVGRPSDEQR